MEWFKVNEKLPEIDKLVITWCNGNYRVCRYVYSRDNWSFKKKAVFANLMSKFRNDEDLTHWCYFPNPPKN